MSIVSFDRARANRQEALVRQAGRNPKTTAEVRNRPSFGAAFGITNDFATVGRAVDELTRDKGDYDTELKPWAYLKDQGGNEDFLNEARRDKDLQNAMMDAYNAQDLEAIVGNWRENRKRFEDAMRDPLGGVLGAIAGILTSPTTYAPSGAGAASKVFRAAALSRRALRARQLALGAGIEGTLGAGIVGLEDIADPGIGKGTYMLGAGIGAVFGGTVGALMKPRNLSAAQKAALEAEKEAEAAAESTATFNRNFAQGKERDQQAHGEDLRPIGDGVVASKGDLDASASAVGFEGDELNEVRGCWK